MTSVGWTFALISAVLVVAVSVLLAAVGYPDLAPLVLGALFIWQYALQPVIWPRGRPSTYVDAMNEEYPL